MQVVSGDKLPSSLGQLLHQTNQKTLGGLEVVVVGSGEGDLPNHLGRALDGLVHQLVAVAHPPGIPLHLPAPARGGDGGVVDDGVGPPACEDFADPVDLLLAAPVQGEQVALPEAEAEEGGGLHGGGAEEKQVGVLVVDAELARGVEGEVVVVEHGDYLGQQLTTFAQRQLVLQTKLARFLPEICCVGEKFDTFDNLLAGIMKMDRPLRVGREASQRLLTKARQDPGVVSQEEEAVALLRLHARHRLPLTTEQLVQEVD